MNTILVSSVILVMILIFLHITYKKKKKEKEEYEKTYANNILAMGSKFFWVICMKPVLCIAGELISIIIFVAINMPTFLGK